MSRCSLPEVLIVDDDPATRAALRPALSRAGFAVQAASLGAEAIPIARSHPISMMVVELRLPDMLGTDVLRTLHDGAKPVRPFVLVSAFLSVSATVEAMRLGASDVMEKPLVAQNVVAIADTVRASLAGAGIALAGQAPGSAPADAHARSAAERWALRVLTACSSEGDLKTLEDWARFVGVSYTSLCESCRLLEIRPHDARDLCRVLRAVLRRSVEQCRPELLLDVSDRRTLAKLLARAGFQFGSSLSSVSAEEFLSSQRFVAARNEGLIELRKLLQRRWPDHERWLERAAAGGPAVPVRVPLKSLSPVSRPPGAG
jgi:ActR/RegA family two-component response regulator